MNAFDTLNDVFIRPNGLDQSVYCMNSTFC
nr:MAG TPA: hypothetical protein [Caudoviricetes sp.]